MARKITKVFGSSSVEMTIRRMNVKQDGTKELVTETYEFAGTRSIAGARAQLTKLLKTSNFMVVDSTVKQDGAPKKYTVSVEKFIAHAELCDENAVYGHDTVTTTVKVSRASYFTMESPDEQHYAMLGTTTERKMRNAIAQSIGDDNILVTNISVGEVRYWMNKDAFIAIADCETETETETETE